MTPFDERLVHVVCLVCGARDVSGVWGTWCVWRVVHVVCCECEVVRYVGLGLWCMGEGVCM